MPIIKLSEVIS